jgi:hypothetical protein
MGDNAKRKGVIRGHGAKKRWQEAKLEALENPINIVDVVWQNLPQP